MSARDLPDVHGHFDAFGGRFVPEALQAALNQLEKTFEAALADPDFDAELDALRRDYAGRPSPLTEAPRFSEYVAEQTGREVRVLLKREDLNHTGSHKINNVLGHALLPRRMGKHRLIAETGAGQHGVATATVAAMMGMECRVYMGQVDTERQALNVARMQLLGAEVFAVEAGSRTLKDAMNEAMRDWVAHVDDTHYLIGTASGPHPFPKLVREFQRVISAEARQQCLDRAGRLPDAVCACVGGGSNAIGSFAQFIDDPEVRLYGFEAGGDGLETGRHAASITGGSVGVLHGTRTYILQDADGQTMESHSISAGLDYPGVGPEHSWLAANKRATYLPVNDRDAMKALRTLTQTEGSMPAFESAHAVAGVLRIVKDLPDHGGEPPIVIVTVSGRGDKDVDTALTWFDIDGSVDATTGGME